MHLNDENAAARGAGGQPNNGALALGSLLADMNHDIRTSMNGVRGMLELLIDTGLTPAQQEYARAAQHNVDDLLESLERIVDMSLIETNSFRFNHAPFYLLQEVQAALAGKQASAAGKDLQLSIVYPPAVRLHGDGARLREALCALVDVAIQIAAGDRVAVTCSARYLPGGLCRIVMDAHIPLLTDNGGALASMMNGPGPGLDSLASRDMLDMAICLRLVQMMKGTITIDRSTPPATVFRLAIDLPLAADALAGWHAIALLDQARQWQSALAPLSRLGMRIDVFETALDGLASIETAGRDGSPYHLILLGRHLDGLDAGVLGGVIKANPAHRNALLVLLSDAARDELPAGQLDSFSAVLRMSPDPAEIECALASLCISATNGVTPTPGRSSADRDAEDRPLGRQGHKVLVADDNPVNQQVAARMLEKLGCVTEVAADGMQAVEMHHWKRYDLILMDCEMPVLDGPEATQRIRAAEGNERRTPIIALTASTGQGEQERCLAAGMDDFVSKPIRPQMLADVLARWLPKLAPASGPAPDPAQPACEDELDEVKEMFGADFAELATLYQNDGPPRLAAIREAAAAGDLAKVAKVAHAMGGSSASIGATGLSALCKALETAAKAGSLDGFDMRMVAIENEYRRICAKLQSLLTP